MSKKIYRPDPYSIRFLINREINSDCDYKERYDNQLIAMYDLSADDKEKKLFDDVFNMLFNRTYQNILSIHKLDGHIRLNELVAKYASMRNKNDEESLISLWVDLDEEAKDNLDKLFSTLCGWSLSTLIKAKSFKNDDLNKVSELMYKEVHKQNFVEECKR